MNDKNSSVYEDTVDILLKSACSSTLDKIFDEIDKSMSDEDIVFSPQHINTVDKILQNERNNKKRHNVKVNLLLAAIVMIITILFSVFMVYAYRILKKHKNITTQATVL